MNISLKKAIIKSSIISSLIAAMYIVVYFMPNVEIIRVQFEDFGFDLLNKYTISSKKQTVDDMRVYIIKVDDHYLFSKGLIDSKKRANYGYVFPRSNIADFIERVDSLKFHPKVLFIDYDVSFGSDQNGSLSKDDNLLLDILKHKRDYKIIFPKTEYTNFIEKRLSNNPNILFASTKYTRDRDFYTRRYKLYETFDGKRYYNVAVLLWFISKDIELNEKNIVKYFSKPKLDNFFDEYKNQQVKAKDIVGYRILLKERGSWLNLYERSAAINDNKLLSIANSIVLYGATNSITNDKKDINSLPDTSEIFGVEFIANSLMSIAYFDGRIKKLYPIYSIFIAWFIFLLIDVVIQLIFYKFNINSFSIQYFITTVLVSIILYMISYILLYYYSLWFNYIVPFIMYQLYEFFSFIEYSYTKE
ncbi:MAG: CHASE2 domain-containing protein [Epsilonproteobacteria bacterium]|nr:CHASE2 domain-containing protein [Campylobacterota bacterium]